MKTVYVAIVIAISAGLIIWNKTDFGQRDNGNDSFIEIGIEEATQDTLPEVKDQAPSSTTSHSSFEKDRENKNKLLSIDDLLDDSDRTEENRIRIENHNNLINVLAEFRDANNTKKFSPTIEKLTQWSQSLVHDAYMENELDQSRLVHLSIEDLNILKPDMIPQASSVTSGLSPNYLSSLRELVAIASQAELSGATQEGMERFQFLFQDILLKRIRHSERFYLNRARRYLFSNGFSMEEKVNFTRRLIESGNWKLANTIKEYFTDSLELETNETNKVMINSLINEIEERGKKGD